MSKMPVETAIGVDPALNISSNVAAGKKRVLLHQMTSDEFFLSEHSVFEPQFSFLDGFHAFEFLLRDFINAEKISDKSSLIGMHDCMPMDDVMTIRNLGVWRTETAKSRFPNAWTGDVWKIIPILLEFRPDLRLHFVDARPTGVVFVSNLDKKSKILEENYWAIVDKYASVENSEREIAAMYSNIDITPTAKILAENDQSLFFNN